MGVFGLSNCTLIALMLAALVISPRVEASPDCVVLLHGLARSSASMSAIEVALKKNAYEVVNIDYPSRENTIELLAQDTIDRGLKACNKDEEARIHFVTHSLGGILVRYYLSMQTIPRLGRVVMLAPPNQGSEVVDNWKNVPGFKTLNGPAGMQLGTGAKSIPMSLGPVSFPLGVIAGNHTINPILSLSLENPDDGKVSVGKTKVAGMSDFVVVPHSHTFIMQADVVIRQVIHFLEHGFFLHSDA
jgi:triacylglycerol lipase